MEERCCPDVLPASPKYCVCSTADVRRVCDEFNISTGDAEQKLKQAATDADVKKELEPLRLGQTKPWANGPESTWDEPLDAYMYGSPQVLVVLPADAAGCRLTFDDHWSSRARERGVRQAAVYPGNVTNDGWGRNTS